MWSIAKDAEKMAVNSFFQGDFLGGQLNMGRSQIPYLVMVSDEPRFADEAPKIKKKLRPRTARGRIARSKSETLSSRSHKMNLGRSAAASLMQRASAKICINNNLPHVMKLLRARVQLMKQMAF